MPLSAYVAHERDRRDAEHDERREKVGAWEREVEWVEPGRRLVEEEQDRGG